MAANPPAGPVARPSIAAHTAANFDKLLDQAYKRKLDRSTVLRRSFGRLRTIQK